MTVHPNDVWRELGYLDEELKRCIAKVGDIRRNLAAMNLPKPPAGLPCPECGVVCTAESRLADHLANVHGR